MADIKLTDLVRIEDPRQYKLHLACSNSEGVDPLDEYVRDESAWHGWNEFRGDRNDWNRKFIFSFIEYHPLPSAWLFGGVFQVQERNRDGYVLDKVADFEKFEGRLVCRFHRYQGMRRRAFKLEKYIDQFEVAEVLRAKYDGERFCGYDRVNHGFAALHGIVRREKQDWKAALSHVKGVYLITDTTDGKAYVGSAYGNEGIWSRLCSYLGTGHGGNDGLVSLLRGKGIEYATANFKFALLEVCNFNTPDEVICGRESHWKTVLLSRQFGHNRN